MSEFRPANLRELNHYAQQTKGLVLQKDLETYRNFINRFYPEAAHAVKLTFHCEYNDNWYDNGVATVTVLDEYDNELQPLAGKESESEEAKLGLPYFYKGVWEERDWKNPNEFYTNKPLYGKEETIILGRVYDSGPDWDAFQAPTFYVKVEEGWSE